MRVEREINKQRESAASAENKFSNIIFAFVRVFSELLHSAPCPPPSRSVTLFPFFPSFSSVPVFFFGLVTPRKSRSLLESSVSDGSPSSNVFLGIFNARFTKLFPVLVAEPTYKFHCTRCRLCRYELINFSFLILPDIIHCTRFCLFFPNLPFLTRIINSCYYLDNPVYDTITVG